LTNKTLSPHTYIPQKNTENWDTSSEKGYYLFINDDNTVQVKTFKQEVVLDFNYTFIGNGVFKLSDNKGYIIKMKNGLKLELSNDNPLVFKDYVLFDK